MNPLLRRLFDFARSWHAFWCSPTDPIVVSTMRWFVGGMLVYTLAVWSVDLEAFFLRDGGWQSEALTKELLKESWAHSLWWLIPDSMIWPFHLGCIAVVGLFWIGCFTKVTKWLALAIVVSYSNRVPLANYGLDQINSVLTLYLCLSPCGEKLSVDSWLRARYRSSGQSHRSEAAGLAIRLIQVHFCIIYLWAGLSKLQGVSWWTGEAVWRAAANYEYQQVSLTWLAYVPWFVQLVSISTWAWELAFPFLIWNARLRYPMLLVGLGMHLGIGMFMGMWTFALIMCFGYLAFVPADTIYAVLKTLRILGEQDIPASATDSTALKIDTSLSSPFVERPLSETVVIVEPRIEERYALGESIKRIGLEPVPVAAWPEAVKIYHALQARTVLCNANRYEPTELKYWVDALAAGGRTSSEFPCCIALVADSRDLLVPAADAKLWQVPASNDEQLSGLLDGHFPSLVAEKKSGSPAEPDSFQAANAMKSNGLGEASQPLKFSLNKSK